MQKLHAVFKERILTTFALVFKGTAFCLVCLCCISGFNLNRSCVAFVVFVVGALFCVTYDSVKTMCVFIHENKSFQGRYIIFMRNNKSDISEIFVLLRYKISFAVNLNIILKRNKSFSKYPS